MQYVDYVTSDLHFYHTNIIKYAERKDYVTDNDESTLKMNDDMVTYINDHVPDEKKVVLWNLGDVFYGKLFSKAPLNELMSIVEAMRGKHRTLKLVMGNHDWQFKKFYKLDKFKHMHTYEIFKYLGFDQVYDYPILFKPDVILSHEPVFLDNSLISKVFNIHGHTHQQAVDSKYFQWKVENREMVAKAFIDSGRELPEQLNEMKKDAEHLAVNPGQYVNVCWDAGIPRVFNLTNIIENLKAGWVIS